LGSRKENRDMNGQTDEGKNVGTASKLTIWSRRHWIWPWIGTDNSNLPSHLVQELAVRARFVAEREALKVGSVCIGCASLAWNKPDDTLLWIRHSVVYTRGKKLPEISHINLQFGDLSVTKFPRDSCPTSIWTQSIDKLGISGRLSLAEPSQVRQENQSH
jgi:hypothetical protein